MSRRRGYDEVHWWFDEFAKIEVEELRDENKRLQRELHEARILIVKLLNERKFTL
jgi:hypothetical protein